MDKRSIKVLEFNTIKQLLVESASSSVGKSLAENLSPVIDKEEVIRLQEETSEAQSLILSKGSVPIGPVYEIVGYAKRASADAVLEPYQLLRIADTLRTAQKVKNFLKDSEATPVLKNLSEDITVLKHLQEAIENAIISEEEISDNASHELKRIRRSVSSLKEQARQKLASMVSSSSYSKYLQESIVTLRQDRFVIPVKAENRANVPGIVHDSSASGATLFIEPIAIVEMNNKLRELKVKEKEEIEKILAELSAETGQHYQNIQLNEKAIAKIDFIMAKGKLSVKMKAEKPEVNDQMFIKLKNARHPLIDPKEVVASNIEIGEKYRTLVITGPNTGGKTVTLKTVGLLSLMAQSGLHIPCDYGTSICIFENIFADIGDEQSIEQSLSTFSSHMTHIVNILNNINARSLVLFDELGAGTDPVEGAALAVAILEKLKGLNVLTIATTHYSELKHYALTTPDVENASVEFDVETLSPTYRLLIGIPGKSNAFEISRKLGLMEDIIESALTHIDSDSIAMEDILKEIDENRRQVEMQKQQTRAALEDAQKLRARFEDKETRIDSQKEKIIEKAKADARKMVTEARAEIDRALKEVKEISKNVHSADLNRDMTNVRANIKASLDKYSKGSEELIQDKKVRNPIKSIMPGDEVFIPSFSQNGTIIMVDDSKKEAQVQIGIMKMNLPFAAMEKTEKKFDVIKSSGAGKIIKSKSSDAKTEIDLRGMDLESAIIEVEKYLDNSYMAGLPQVTIIHGVGTLVLKTGIQKLLKKNKHVKSFRDGAYGEGGMGVTIAELK